MRLQALPLINEQKPIPKSGVMEGIMAVRMNQLRKKGKKIVKTVKRAVKLSDAVVKKFQGRQSKNNNNAIPIKNIGKQQIIKNIQKVPKVDLVI